MRERPTTATQEGQRTAPLQPNGGQRTMPSMPSQAPSGQRTAPLHARDEQHASALTAALALEERTPFPLPEEPPDEEEFGQASFRAVLNNAPFRSLWIAQICSQLAQNLTWITLGAFVANQTHKNTLVSVIIVSASMAQIFLSGFAGVLVDRASKRGVLVSSNALRVLLAMLFILATPLPVAIQTTTIIFLIFVANAVAQFFMPAEAATIPLLVERRNLIAATSLFNITFNACQVIPITLGLLAFSLWGIVPVLLIVAGLYVAATALVWTLPAKTAVTRHIRISGSLHEAAGHVIGDLREALRFLSRDPGLRLTIFQINIAPTVLFIFGTLGLRFVQETFGLNSGQAWRLLLPAGVGLILGALVMGRLTARFRKEDLINVGLLAMGVGIAALGAVAVITNALFSTARRVGGFISTQLHTVPLSDHASTLHNAALIPPAMLVSFAIGFAMAMSTIPAQTLVFERTSENVRGRVLSMQQLIGGAIPIIPLLTVAALADIFGTSTVMTLLGVIVVLVGVLTVHLERQARNGPDKS